VVALDDLVQSHLDTFDINPKYPKELQPRNRDRAAYREQVYEIARTLDERAMIETPWLTVVLQL
jgi:ribosomal protein S30